MEESEANRQKEAAADGFKCRKNKDGTLNWEFIPFIHPSSLLFLGMRNENRSWCLEGDPSFVLLFYLHCHNPGCCRLELEHSTWAAWSPLCPGRDNIKRNPKSETKTTLKPQFRHNERVNLGLFFRSSLIIFIMDIKNCKPSLELTVIFILSIRGVKKGKTTEAKRNIVNSRHANGDVNKQYLWRTHKRQSFM